MSFKKEKKKDSTKKEFQKINKTKEQTKYLRECFLILCEDKIENIKCGKYLCSREYAER